MLTGEFTKKFHENIDKKWKRKPDLWEVYSGLSLEVNYLAERQKYSWMTSYPTYDGSSLGVGD